MKIECVCIIALIYKLNLTRGESLYQCLLILLSITATTLGLSL